jgi:hypothetical protein
LEKIFFHLGKKFSLHGISVSFRGKTFSTPGIFVSSTGKTFSLQEIFVSHQENCGFRRYGCFCNEINRYIINHLCFYESKKGKEKGSSFILLLPKPSDPHREIVFWQYAF